MPIRATPFDVNLKPIRFSSSINLENPEQKCLYLLQSPILFHHLKQILAFFFTNGLQKSSFLATKLTDFCRSARRMEFATSIFSQIPHPNSFLWTSMIRGFTENGPQHQSLHFFDQMLRQGIKPNHLTFPFVLKSCRNLTAVEEGKQIHTHIFKTGFLSDIYVQNGVVDWYAKCGLIEEARQVFDEMPERDIVTITAMISGYFSFGDLLSARLIFDEIQGADVVLWSAMIAGYAQNGAPDEALDLFDQMESIGVKPNSVTMVSVISACAQLGDFEKGKEVHDLIIRNGLEMTMIVSTSLLDMYIKGGFVDEALQIFNKIPQRDIVSWNSLINGYSKNGYASEALEVFRKMQDLHVEPNRVTVMCILSACAQLGALDIGKEIHHLVLNMEIESDISIETSLLDMYAKCGNLFNACLIFHQIHQRDVVAWSAMINGYAMNGLCKEALSLFGGMIKEGVRPNGVTFVGILAACSHRGLVTEGYEYFNSMCRDYSISPRMEHYASMVDLLGRAGQISEAKWFVDNMPIEPGANVWGSLLGACTTHKNIEVGEYAAQNLVEVEPLNEGNYVLLTNIYASTGRWEDVEKIRKTLKDHGAQKIPGCSWIEMEGKIHEFHVGDRSHPQFLEIYGLLHGLSEQLRLVEDFHIEEWEK